MAIEKEFSSTTPQVIESDMSLQDALLADMASNHPTVFREYRLAMNHLLPSELACYQYATGAAIAYSHAIHGPTNLQPSHTHNLYPRHKRQLLAQEDLSNGTLFMLSELAHSNPHLSASLDEFLSAREDTVEGRFYLLLGIYDISGMFEPKK